MSERVFIDTNVWVYADDASSAKKRKLARAWVSELVADGRAVISTQVLQEFFVIATKKLGLSVEAARHRVEVMRALDVVVIRPDLVVGAIDLHRLHALSFWDALILKAAISAGCTTLLSEDLSDGQRFEGLIVRSPFKG